MLSNHSLALSLRQRLYRMVAIQGRGPKTHSSQHQHVIQTHVKVKSDTHYIYIHTRHRILFVQRGCPCSMVNFRIIHIFEVEFEKSSTPDYGLD